MVKPIVSKFNKRGNNLPSNGNYEKNINSKDGNDKKKKKKPKNPNMESNRTIAVKGGRISHALSSKILSDAKYNKEDKKCGYMEDYFLDEKSQLEKRIAIGDRSYLDHLKEDDKEIMKSIIEDIQSQMLTHNGFVQTMREYRKKIDEKVLTQMTQVEEEYDKEHNIEDIDDDEQDDNEHGDDDDDESILFGGTFGSKEQRKLQRDLMEKRTLFLEERRELIRNQLIENISLEIKKPFKNPTNIHERRLNDPRTGVACNFVPSDQVCRKRANVYRCVHKKGDYYLQSIDERRAEYDLMAYPLFFPEGSHLKMGWTDNVPKVMTKKVLVKNLYKRLKKMLPPEERTNNRKLSERLEVIADYFEVDDLKLSDFDYEHLIDMKNPNISVQQWYNFMLYERAGFIKEKHFTPEMELHEYYTSCNMKLKKRKKTSDRCRELEDDDVVYSRSSTEEETEFTVKVHPESRCPYIVVDGVEYPINPNTEEEEEKRSMNIDSDDKKKKYDYLPIRHPEKKNPILYPPDYLLSL